MVASKLWGGKFIYVLVPTWKTVHDGPPSHTIPPTPWTAPSPLTANNNDTLPIKSPRKSIKSPRKSPGKRKTPQPSPQTETTDLAKVCVSHDTSKATLPELLYGDDPSLQEYYLARHRKAYFDHAFIEETKTIQESGKLDNRSTKTKQDLQHIVDVVTHWNTTAKYEKDGSLLPKELKEFREFKKNNKAGFKWRQYYNIEKILLPGDNEETIVIRRMEVKNKQKYVGRIIVSQEDSFDRIQEHHRMSGHLGAESTYNNCNLKYFNITQAMVQTFCKTCPTCLEKNPILPPHVGAQKVIYSHQWRDRFQVDLIDMRKFARPNVYGVVQNWIMTVKDHFSGFTALFSIPQKKAEYVAHELEKYFGLFGYPTIFQTDNGNEFVARQLLDMIAEINPAIITVTGRPRTPRDQGSVERANQTVKRILADVCAERRKDGKDDNWTKFLGMITAQLNTHHTRQANSVSPYRTVFGSDYHLLTKTSLSDTRKCKTIGQLQDLVIDDGHLKDYATKAHNLKRFRARFWDDLAHDFWKWPSQWPEMTPKIVRENRAQDRAETTPPATPFQGWFPHDLARTILCTNFHEHKSPSQERKASARYSSTARRRPEIVRQNRSRNCTRNLLRVWA